MTGFIGMPSLQDIERLEQQVAALQQRLKGVEHWIEGFMSGKGATEVMYPMNPR